MNRVNIDREMMRRILVRSLRISALVALGFSIIMGVLVLATFIQLKVNDPLASPALTTLYERLRDNPEDSALKDEIRSLDLLARKAYFTSRAQVTLGGVMLLVGAGVFIFSFAFVELLKKKMPVSPKDRPLPELLVSRLLERKLVAVTGAVLFAASIVFLLVVSPLLEVRPAALPKNDGTTVGQDKSLTLQGKNETDANSKSIPNASPSKFYSDEFLSFWPNFRGPYARALAPAGNWPISWDGAAGKGILWKATPPKPGFSSPIVFGNFVFVTGALATSEGIYCYNALTGALVFSHEMPGLSGNTVTVAEQTGFAAPSVATDGKVAVAVFANGDVVAVDMAGNMLWAENLGVPEINYGYASSPVTFGDLVIIQFDQKKGPKLIAKKLTTGDTVWQTERDVLSSWATPVVAEIKGKPALVLSANPFVAAYDASSGKELWSADVFTGEIGSSPVYADGIVYAGNDTARLAALAADDGSLLWEYYEDLPDASSPAVSSGLLIMASSGAVVTCLDAGKGDLLWKQEFTDGFYASPVIAGDRVYLLDKEGVMHVVALKREYSLLATLSLGEQAVATPAFAKDKIYIRGKKNLYCIGK